MAIILLSVLISFCAFSAEIEISSKTTEIHIGDISKIKAGEQIDELEFILLPELNKKRIKIHIMYEVPPLKCTRFENVVIYQNFFYFRPIGLARPYGHPYHTPRVERQCVRLVYDHESETRISKKITIKASVDKKATGFSFLVALKKANSSGQIVDIDSLIEAEMKVETEFYRGSFEELKIRKNNPEKRVRKIKLR